jgi:hypothetical protein
MALQAFGLGFGDFGLKPATLHPAPCNPHPFLVGSTCDQVCRIDDVHFMQVNTDRDSKMGVFLAAGERSRSFASCGSGR